MRKACEDDAIIRRNGEDHPRRRMAKPLFAASERSARELKRDGTDARKTAQPC